MSSPSPRQPRPAAVAQEIPASPPPPDRRRGAGFPAGLLVLLGAVLLLLALPLTQLRQATQPDQLAAHAGAVLADRQVQDAVADEATTRITNRVAGDSGLAAGAVRAIVAPRVEKLVASKRFSAAWEESVRVAATRLLDPDTPDVELTIDDVAGLTAAATQPFPPAIERPLRRAGPVTIVRVERTPDQQRGVEALDELNGSAIPGLIFAGLVLLLALAVSRNRRRTAGAIGAAVLIVGLLLLAVQAVVGSAVVGGAAPGRSRDVTDAVWSELIGGLQSQSLIAVAVGAVVIAAAWATGRARRGAAA